MWYTYMEWHLHAIFTHGTYSRNFTVAFHSVRFLTFVWQISPDHQITRRQETSDAAAFLNTSKKEAPTAQTLEYREAAACTHGV
jgi:hypothetical protein